MSFNDMIEFGKDVEPTDTRHTFREWAIRVAPRRTTCNRERPVMGRGARRDGHFQRDGGTPQHRNRCRNRAALQAAYRRWTSESRTMGRRSAGCIMPPLGRHGTRLTSNSEVGGKRSEH